ncbi:hypothetical protein HK105_202694 [Polyrhizophydium stewartii]|uniref:Calcineurin-like phosphoesterase domain-containing protein n=1 Tax=Polyrhizophydium stewartii TaxID=2732419 RepID=A0ABR4NED8_9FUNG|nr:hypothetical protein HK105_004963 [Polyrhizophydium stewartii]
MAKTRSASPQRSERRGRSAAAALVRTACAALLAAAALALAPRAAAFGTACKLGGVGPSALSLLRGEDAQTLRSSSPTPMKDKDEAWEVKVAFTGDQGLGVHPRRVLRMMRDWGAQALVQLGDFDYEDDPEGFMDQFTEVMGNRFPKFAVVGNHDVAEWYTDKTGYRDRLTKQATKSRVLRNCVGDYGINMVCKFHGIVIVMSGIGTLGTDHATFIDQALSQHSDAKWKLCVWHKNQQKYQTGDKKDETGYLVYDTCRRHGAIVLTSHEHSYARTHLMSDFEGTQIASTSNTLVVQPGRSFVALAGLGGDSIRYWKDGLQNNPWWAATAAMDNGVNYGALLCVFHHKGKIDRANCKFKDIDGKTWDKFTVVSQADMPVNATTGLPQSLPAPQPARSHMTDTAVRSLGDVAAVDMTTGAVRCGTGRMHLAPALDASDLPTRRVVHALTFRIPAPSGEITHAHLQIMAAHPPPHVLARFGRKADAFKAYVDSTDLRLRIWRARSRPQCPTPDADGPAGPVLVMHNEPGMPLAHVEAAHALDSDAADLGSVEWTRGPRDEAWEVGEVFVSPNIAHLVATSVAERQPAADGTIAVTIALEGVWWPTHADSAGLHEGIDLTRAFYGVPDGLGLCVAPSLVVHTRTD